MGLAALVPSPGVFHNCYSRALPQCFVGFTCFGHLFVLKIIQNSLLCPQVLEYSFNFNIFFLQWMDWHPAASVLLAGSSDGEMWMWKIPSGDTKTFQSHGVACNIAKVLPNGGCFQFQCEILGLMRFGVSSSPKRCQNGCDITRLNCIHCSN